MRIENLDWQNRVIFVPDSKTPEGRRLVPMSRRVFEIPSTRCGTRKDGWVFPSRRSAPGTPQVDLQFVSPGSQCSWTTEGTSPLLCTPRLRHQDPDSHRKLGSSDENDG